MTPRHVLIHTHLTMSQPIFIDMIRANDEFNAKKYDLSVFVDNYMEDHDLVGLDAEIKLWRVLQTVVENWIVGQDTIHSDYPDIAEQLFDFFEFEQLPDDLSDYAEAIDEAIMMLEDA